MRTICIGVGEGVGDRICPFDGKLLVVAFFFTSLAPYPCSSYVIGPFSSSRTRFLLLCDELAAPDELDEFLLIFARFPAIIGTIDREMLLKDTKDLVQGRQA